MDARRLGRLQLRLRGGRLPRHGGGRQLSLFLLRMSDFSDLVDLLSQKAAANGAQRLSTSVVMAALAAALATAL